jgi:pentatricopeptide repeat protein
MVDVLSRAKHFEEAEKLILQLDEHDPIPYKAFLGAIPCRSHDQLERGERMAKRMLDLFPEDASVYILLANIYSDAGRWEDALKVRELMEGRGIKKVPGMSTVAAGSEIRTFVANDPSKDVRDELQARWDQLVSKMKNAGYKPNTRRVLHNIEEDEKEHLLCKHSEKMAIVWALNRTQPHETITLTKNLRVCEDCHEATKFISVVEEREIIVRDANRFHEFNDGKCSCGDYW